MGFNIEQKQQALILSACPAELTQSLFSGTSGPRVCLRVSNPAFCSFMLSVLTLTNLSLVYGLPPLPPLLTPLSSPPSEARIFLSFCLPSLLAHLTDLKSSFLRESTVKVSVVSEWLGWERTPCQDEERESRRGRDSREI